MSAFDSAAQDTASGDAASAPQGNFLIVGKPASSKTVWPWEVLAQDSCKFFSALPDSASLYGPYVAAFAFSNEEFARVRSPQQV